MKKNYVQLQKWFIAFCSILTMPLSLLAQKEFQTQAILIKFKLTILV
jgi:uncharacterized membrane protein YqaE (UPF0057 family)